MDLGFDTIGNATLIVYDRGPLLVTDPWIEGDAYFGSWTRSHEIPPEQHEAIVASRYCWLSHGHPDHLSMASLRRLRNPTILLADHVGGRVAAALRGAGFRVDVLADRTWVPLSDRVRVCAIADYNQDSILLVDLDGVLVIDTNDSSERGSRAFVRAAARRATSSFLLQQAGYGDADMINLFDEDGTHIPPVAARREPPGAALATIAAQVGARFVVPFSAMHRYQRSDSIWANEHRAEIHELGLGFSSDRSELVEPFVRYDRVRDELTPLAPAASPDIVLPPSAFGDDWDEPLDDDDRGDLDRYVRSFAHLERVLRFVAFEVGGERHTVGLRRPRAGRPVRGVTFAAPRTSLMTAVREQVFDDLMIGNFVRTTVHGDPRADALYPNFTPYVCKYGDNGGARTPDELRAYFQAYRTRAPAEYLRHRIERGAADRVRQLVPTGSAAHRLARRALHAATSSRGR